MKNILEKFGNETMQVEISHLIYSLIQKSEEGQHRIMSNRVYYGPQKHLHSENLKVLEVWRAAPIDRTEW